MDGHAAIPLLKKHLAFIRDQHAQFVEAGNTPEELDELFTLEWILDEMQKVVTRGAGHLTEV